MIINPATITNESSFHELIFELLCFYYYYYYYCNFCPVSHSVVRHPCFAKQVRGTRSFGYIYVITDRGCEFRENSLVINHVRISLLNVETEISNHLCQFPLDRITIVRPRSPSKPSLLSTILSRHIHYPYSDIIIIITCTFFSITHRVYWI